MARIHGFVTKKEVNDVLETHPNDIVGPWWDNPVDNLPPLRPFQLPRDPISLSTGTIPVSTHRVSLKKQHEVGRMTQFIADLLPARFPGLRLSGVHIVDVGAGQAYVTRALHSLFDGPTLALDFNHAYTHSDDGISYKTVHITPQSLLKAIDDWIPTTFTSTPPSRTPRMWLSHSRHTPCLSLRTQKSTQPPHMVSNRRLGKLNNAVYADWPTFLNAASERLGWDASRDTSKIEYDTLLARRLELLHNLRCKLGPVIETLIILDRVDWVKEVLGQIQHNHLQVELVNLFDQAAGSGRNIAIVIAPPQPK